MKLEGSLDAFSLPDIFQLLSFTKKTGGLHLAHDGSDGVVFFAGGQVTGASADSHVSRWPAGSSAPGRSSDDALVAAVEAASAGEGTASSGRCSSRGRSTPSCCAAPRPTSPSTPSSTCCAGATGTSPSSSRRPTPTTSASRSPVESVVADAEARRASWETVSQVVPSPRAVLAMPVVLPVDPQVSREEWSLLALVDGRRTVTDLVDLTGSGQYAVVSTLAALVQRGLLEVARRG